MEDDLRARILHLVEKYPGLHLREVQRKTKCSPMLAEYHLNVLEKLGLVTSSTHGRYRDFFPSKQGSLALSDQDKEWLGMLRRPAILSIALQLLEHGSMRPLQLARQLGLASSTATYQVKTGSEAGLFVNELREGRTMIRLMDAERVLEILQAYHPTPDAVSEYAALWSRIFARPAPAEPLGSEEADENELPEEIKNASRAVQSVYKALRQGPLTQKELCLDTSHARRTVYGSLKKLDALGFLASHIHMLDTRQTKYWLKDENRNDDSEGNS